MPELPVLLLSDTVIFPDTTAALHVKESSDRKVVRHALTKPNRSFAVAYHGATVGLCDGPPRLPRHGTRVEILASSENSDGSIDLEVIGRERVASRLLREERFTDHKGHTSSLLFIRNEPAPLGRNLHEEQLHAWDAVETVREYVSTFYEPAAREEFDFSLPEDPARLSAFLCANVSVGPATRQLLLDAASLDKRLQMVQDLASSSLTARANAFALPF